ncbi:MAG: DNA polymerase [Veillonellaceae bacterium]|nr:DNA polymerase [Veillonellaceae bacterium]
MKTISIDIETYSSVSLQKAGVYKYSESDDFEIMLFGYSIDNGEVQVVDLASGEKIPADVLAALYDDSVEKWAFNAMFERICLSNYLGEWLKPDSWHCTMIWAATLGLPLSLEGAGAVLGLEKQKLSEGKNLIRYFCVPCAPTKSNGGRTRNLPEHDLEKWQMFKAYNLRDVETEMSIQRKLSRFPVPEAIWAEYHLDQEINDRGIGLDMDLVRQAIAIDSISREELTRKMQDLTDLDNPNSVLQMKVWLADNGLEMDTLGKKAVAETLKTAPEHLAEVLSLRQQLAKSSVKKYAAMETAACRDFRARGMFQFYGANRTGRFAGRIIQLQNLPQNHISDLAEARALVKSGNYEALSLLYDDIPDTLSQLIRTAFVPQDGRKFIVADFSAIEARVLAWLAGEKWRMKVFAEGKDIYCSSAQQMFGVPVEKHGINGHLRQKGKIAELALGYGGSVGALTAMGALEMGLSEDELQPLVNAWRNANPMITVLWWEVDRAIKRTVKERVATEAGCLHFIYESGFLFIILPSGRRLAYVKPRMGINKFGSESVTYEGVGATKKWERLESYGPKFVENATQAIARDILMYALGNLRNCSIVGHVHDEVIIEADTRMSLDAVCQQMERTPPWAEGLLLRADGYECNFYKKD